MKRLICLFLALVLICGGLVSCNKKYTESEEPTNYVLLTVEGYGDILVELYPEYAPITVANFQKLVSEGAYDNTIFHRVIKDFMIQGGGYNEGDSILFNYPNEADTIKGEFSENGVENDLKHERGVLSMARTDDMDSASNQFFICHNTDNVTHLDGKYAAFGRVLEGMDVVDRIAKVSTNPYDQPYQDVVLTSARFVVLKRK